MRTRFTDKATAAIHGEVVPQIARYGFDRLWTELHRSEAGEGNWAAVDKAESALAWHQARAELHDLYGHGDIELVPVPHDPRRPQQVRVIPEYRGGNHWETVAARCMIDGDHVGWMSDNARLYPLDDTIR